MRQVRRIIAALMTAVLLAGCSNAVPQSEVESYTPELTPEYEEGCVTPPFWVVTDEDTGAQIFLMGSIHAGTNEVKYPEYVLRAFRSSSYVAPEMDTVAFSGDIGLQRKCSGYMKLRSGTAADYFGDDYADIVEFFRQKGIYKNGMDSMIPYYWASAASGLVTKAAGLDSRNGSETILLKLAHGGNKAIREIEGGDAQYRLFRDTPMSVQLDLLRGCIGDDNIAAQAASSVELYKAWSSFDSEYFSGLSVFDPDEVTAPDDWQSYYDMMYTDRQRLMAEFITDSLKSGERGFVFVGTLHFYAEPSILTLLEEAGYTAEEIRPAKSGEEIAA